VPAKYIPDKYIIRIFDKFSPISVKYKDIFDMKEYYTALYYWLQEYGWEDGVPKSPKQEWFERYYNEKIDPSGAKEIWIRWRLNKPVPRNNKLRYHLDMDFHVIALTSTEVIKEGQKIKVNKGEVELKINGSIEKLYEREFDNSGSWGKVKKLFTKRVYDKTIEEKKKELYQEMYVLQNFIKQWFKLKRYLPYEEVRSFHPSFAWPSHHKEE